jgi:hypothetical protein
VFAGEEFEEESPPESSYHRKLRMVNQKLQELEEREKRVSQEENKLGLQQTK